MRQAPEQQNDTGPRVLLQPLKSGDLEPASKLARPARYHARTRDMTQGPCAYAKGVVGHDVVVHARHGFGTVLAASSPILENPAGGAVRIEVSSCVCRTCTRRGRTVCGLTADFRLRGTERGQPS